MSFAAVAWSYKDIITSAKLAQMVENVRTHDHLTTDQGGQFGSLAEVTYAVTSQSITDAVAHNITSAAATFTITSNAATGRKIYFVLPVSVITGAAAIAFTLGVAMTGTGSTSTTPANAGGVPFKNVSTTQEMKIALWRASCPPAGVYTLTPTITFATANAGNQVLTVGPGLVALL